MKVLQVTENLFEELANEKIVVCLYNSKLGQPIFGIDLLYKDQYPLLNEVDVIDESDVNDDVWHEPNKPIQLVQSQDGFNWTAINFTELTEYRKTMNISTYQYNGKFYYYLHFIENAHRTIFENKEDEHGNKLPGFYIDIKINEK